MTERDAKQSARRDGRAAKSVVVAAVIVTGALSAQACKTSNSGATAEPAGSSATPAATNQQTGPTPEPAASAFSAASYDVSMKAAGPYKAGQPGVVTIVLAAKAPYHCNDKYPYKLKLEDSPGVKYPDKLVSRDAVKVEHMQATMSVPFTPESPGTKTIAGKYLFSVCSAENCLVEKRDLKLDVNVM